MRILWFANTPSLAENKLESKPTGGGWIKSLEKGIKGKVMLGVVFYYNKKIAPFYYNDTKYFPVYLKSDNKFGKIFARIKGRIEPDEHLEDFVQIIKEYKPDIIHVLGSESSFGLIVKRIKDIPIVISIQGNINVYHYKWYSGICPSDITKYSRVKDKVLFKTYNSQYKAFTNRALREKRILKDAKYIIGRTAWDRRISSVLSPNGRYFHNNEILRDSFYNFVWENHYNYKESLRIFTTNGPNIYKGIEVVLYAAFLLDNLKFDYKWHIAGYYGNEEIINIALKSLKIQLSSNIIFEGKLKEDELINKLLNSHLYVMPSHIENSPNNLCEAMILGLPCIAADAGGTSTLLQNGKEGILLQDGDPWALAGSILELVNNYGKAIQFGLNARKIALQRHNPEKIVNDLLNIYSEILKNDK